MSCETVRNAWIAADKELTQAAADAETADAAAVTAAAEATAAEARLKTAGATADEAYSRYVKCTTGEPFATQLPS